PRTGAASAASVANALGTSLSSTVTGKFVASAPEIENAIGTTRSRSATVSSGASTYTVCGTFQLPGVNTNTTARCSTTRAVLPNVTWWQSTVGAQVAALVPICADSP